MKKSFPWRILMAFGFGRLRLSSAAFWAMTPREFSAAVEGLLGHAKAPMERGEFDALIRRFPDSTRLSDGDRD